MLELRRGGQDRAQAWREALDQLGVRLDTSGGVSDLLAALRRLSAGEQLAVMTVTDLVVNLTQRAIVLHDEPETHLHPRLLAGLLRAIHALLARFDAYAVLATHSLVPVQESLSSNVFIFERRGDSVFTRTPSEECFAGTLDDIQREVFRVGESDQNYHRRVPLLRALSAEEQARLVEKPGLGLRLALAQADEEPRS
jgi:ABC-type glutathione transport system ATPase component